MIKIKKYKPEDAPQLAFIANNKKIWNNLRNVIPYPYSLDDAKVFIRFVSTSREHLAFGVFQDDKLVGTISLELGKDIYTGTAELGYFIGEPFWGRGIATKAVELITHYGFEELNLRRIYAAVFAPNKASMRVLEKNGYQLEGILKKRIIKEGVVMDEFLFARLA